MGQTVYLTRKAIFSASHRLHSDHLSDEENRKIFGKCNHINGHGHNYLLEVTLKGKINKDTGMLFNLTDLKRIIEEHVLDKIDHKNLNIDIAEFKENNPTTENLAVIIWDWLFEKIPNKLLYEIRIHETDNNIVCYRGE